MRLAFLALLTFGLSLIGFTQGQMWNQNLDHNQVSIARGADGNIYAAGFAFTPSIVPIVSCYSPSGQFLYRVVSQVSYGANSAKTSDLHIVGNELLFTLAVSGPSSVLFRFDTNTRALTSTPLQSAGDNINARSLAVGSTTYCVAGGRVSDGSDIIQVRSLADDSLLREVVTSHDLQKAFQSGSYFYVIGTTFNPTMRVVVHRVNASSNSSYFRTAPNAANPFLEGVFAGRNLFLISNYYNGVTTFNIFVVPFNIQTLTFGPSWEENASATESYVRTVTKLGSTSLFMGLHNRAIGIGADGSMLFEVAYPDMSNSAFSGISATDAGGNAVCMVEQNGENMLFRFSPTGLILNRQVVGLPSNNLGQMTLDAAGVPRFSYELPSLHDWWLGCLQQASLDLPGPYTVGGNTLTGTVSLGGPAPAGGATFDLFSNNAAAIVPTTVTIPAGQTSANFTITTSAVAANTKPTINARYNGIVLQSNFDLAAPLVQSITATPQSQYGGVNITGSVVLTGPAPTGGKTVTLTSSNTSRVTVPASVLVPAGSSSANFVVTTFPTLVNASSVVTATTGAMSKTVFVAVVAPVFQNATLATNSIKGGQSTTMTLTIGTPAPSGYTITLVSGSPNFVQLPTSFAIPAGQSTVNVPVTTSPVTSSMPVTLFAYRGPYIKTMTLTVTP